MPFRDRRDAGARLAEALTPYRDKRPIVAALPRGGVVTADEIARVLVAPLEVVLVRKLGTPGRRELAMGAIAEGDVVVLNEEIVEGLRIPLETIREVQTAESAELRRRAERYRGTRPRTTFTNRVVIVVDDGLATGMTARAAVRAVRALGAEQVVFAVPVGSPRSVRELAGEVDEIICLEQPAELLAIGQWYDSFDQVTDEEVVEILK